MKFRELHCDAGDAQHLEKLVERFRETSGVRLPEHYVRACSIVGGFDDAGDMVCGYLIASGEGMRWPTLVPVTTPFQRRVSLAEVAELNGVWLDPKLRGRAEAAKLWIRIGRDLGSRGFRFITFAVDSRKAGLVRLYRPIKSGRIYSGPLRGSHVPHAQVFYSRRWRFRWLVPLYTLGLLKRFLGRGLGTRTPRFP